METQRHRFHEVFLLLHGTVRVSLIDDSVTERVLHPGDYLVVPAGVSHRLLDDRASTLILVAFSHEAVTANVGRRTLWDAVRSRLDGEYPVLTPSTGIADGAWRTLLAIVHERPNRSTTDPTYRIELETAFDRFLLGLYRMSHATRQLDARERVRAFRRTLGERVHEQWSLDRAALETHMSRRRFSQLWREETGETFVSSLQGYRVLRTQTLIREEGLSVIAAALAAGFNDIANFYRVFRRCVGCSPGAWATQIDPRVNRGRTTGRPLR